MSNVDQYYGRFERAGEAAVRRSIAGGLYDSTKKAYALEWLAEIDRNRAAEADARTAALNSELAALQKRTADATEVAAAAARDSASAADAANAIARSANELASTANSLASRANRRADKANQIAIAAAIIAALTALAAILAPLFYLPASPAIEEALREPIPNQKIVAAHRFSLADIRRFTDMNNSLAKEIHAFKDAVSARLHPNGLPVILRESNPRGFGEA